MQQVVILPEQAFPAKLMLNPELAMNDDAYFDFCVANPDIRFERNEQGEIIIVPPAGPESDYRGLDVAAQLREWARRDGRGKALGSTTEFFLPTGAALSPDSAWISNVRLSQFSKLQRRKFLHIAPEFIVEVMSPSDRLSAAKEKMQMWIRGGVDLAWLIDGDNRTVYVYRADREPEALSEISTLAGEGAIAGFQLDLTDIWAGL
jgi:Uma2 family endonuclease